MLAFVAIVASMTGHCAAKPSQLQMFALGNMAFISAGSREEMDQGPDDQSGNDASWWSYGTWKNVARGSTTTQSGTYKTAVSGNAVDGNYSGNYKHGSCTHTDDGSYYNPWWQVELESDQWIVEVALTNRNLYSDRL